MSEEVRAEITEKLKGELAEVDRRLAAVRAEQTALEREHKSLTVILTEIQGLQSGKLPVVATTSGPNAVITLARTTPPPAKAVLTLPDAAQSVLRDVGHPLHVRELIPLIQARGVYPDRSYEDVRASLVSTLDRWVARGRTFVKVGRGTYGLVQPLQAQAS